MPEVIPYGAPCSSNCALAGDVPVPADYDGDGDADVAVYRPATGQWFVRGALREVVQYGLGCGACASPADIPVPADYTGDGVADRAVYRATTGQWFVHEGPQAAPYGEAGDVPAPADYDGDGVVDFAVFRPSTGQWFRRGISPEVVQYGAGGACCDDVPVPADYDGGADAGSAADVAAYRRSSGQWFVQGGSPEAVPYGTTGDVPLAIPAAIHVATIPTSSQSANAASDNPSVSADGRFVAFESSASNLAPGDTNAAKDIFLRDRGLAGTVRVSLTSAGGEANGESSKPAISADGRYVAFVSSASNLVSGDTNGTSDVFVWDRSAGTTVRVSVTSAGVQGNGPSDAPSISSDGRYVAFSSGATNLVAGDTNAAQDIFVRDTLASTTERVNLTSTAGQANGNASSPDISPEGRYVAFASAATNLVPGDTNARTDVFVRDRNVGSTTRVSVADGGAQSNGASDSPAISSDGRSVAFRSEATNLVGGDTNGASDVFLRDRIANTTLRLSITSGGAQGSGASDSPRISSDGRYIAFRSDAPDLVAMDTNGASDIFERDVNTPKTTRISNDDARGQGDGASYSPSISDDGGTAVFASVAANLSLADINGVADILVHVFDAAREVCTIGRASNPGPLPFIEVTPREGMTIYRVWGGAAGPYGQSWTTRNPLEIGADEYRISAGLPDRFNDGTMLTTATLHNPTGVIPKRADASAPRRETHRDPHTGHTGAG